MNLLKACQVASQLLLLPLVAYADLQFPSDPREITAWAMYSQPNNCGTAPNCMTGYQTRQLKGVWLPVSVEQLGLPADTAGVFLTAHLNVTHPAKDKSTCYLQMMAASDAGLPFVTGRTSQQWLFRVMSDKVSQRTTQSAWVKVQEGRFWVRYTYRGGR